MRQGKVLQITFCVVILFSCAFFTFLYWNDNKYKNDPNERSEEHTSELQSLP